MICVGCVAFHCAFSPTTFDALVNLANIYFLNKLFTTTGKQLINRIDTLVNVLGYESHRSLFYSECNDDAVSSYCTGGKKADAQTYCENLKNGNFSGNSFVPAVSFF